MKDRKRARVIVGACLVASLALPGAASDNLSVTKAVDRHSATHSDVLTYTITVTNTGIAGVSTGWFTDTFPDEVTGCTWTCSAAGSGWCDYASGSGDIDQLISVPMGSSATIDATCTFVPSPGHACAVNTAGFFTMDPDSVNRGTATTCEPWVIVFFNGFETGDLASWDDHR